MSEYNYSGIVSTAQRLINKFGRDITLITQTQSGTDYAPTITETSSMIKAVITNFSTNEIDGTIIQSSDKKILTYDEIKPEQIVSIDGQRLSIVNVDTVSPGDTKIIYKGQLRK